MGVNRWGSGRSVAGVSPPVTEADSGFRATEWDGDVAAGQAVATRRARGVMTGQVAAPPDFDRMVDADIAKMFDGDD